MKEVERHSVTGYGRQDINYNDPEGEFVYYEDYTALKDSAMDYAYRWGKAQDDIKKAHMLHSMQKEEITSLKEQLTATANILKSAGIEADTVQAGVMELVSKLAELHQIRNERDAAIQGAERKERELSRTYQQFSAMQADTERMNYLAGKVVNVRTPLPYGSHNIFWSQCITDDSDPSYETDLREQIDAQLRAGNAGKDGSHE